jgi:hypothetical protein
MGVNARAEIFARARLHGQPLAHLQDLGQDVGVVIPLYFLELLHYPLHGGVALVVLGRGHPAAGAAPPRCVGG